MATLSNGYQIGNMETTGYPFVGAWSYKGCKVYTEGSYTGFAFYGAGGTVEEKQLPLKYPYNYEDGIRPEGYDCN